MSKEPLQKVDFTIIRYANCWEDPDRLLEGLNLEEDKKVLSIGSGGDNSFSLLVTNPSLVVAIDVSKVQLFLIELKKEAIKLLNREAYLKFIGFEKDSQENRVAVYNKIKVHLTEENVAYWNKNIEVLKEGIVHQGKFEKYFQVFSKKVMPFIHSKKTTAKLLAPKSSEEQINFFDKKWNTIRWRFFFKIFFSKFVLGRLGRDSSFLNEVNLNVSEFILNQAKKHLSSPFAQSNFILNYALTGDFQGDFPHYVREENYEKIKANLDKLVCFHGYAEDAIGQYGKFDAFNLSNIFEYLNTDIFQALTDQLKNGGNANAKYAYWNLMVDRDMSDKDSDLKHIESSLKPNDKGFFYKRLVINQKV